MFEDLYSAIEQYDESQGPQGNKQALMQFARKVEKAQREQGNEWAADMIHGFMVGYHSCGGVIPSNLGSIKVKLEIIRIKLGGK